LTNHHHHDIIHLSKETQTEGTEMNNYEVEAVQDMEISEDGLGLYCSIQSEMNKDVVYTVRCTESAHEVVAHSCTCKGFYYYNRCKHVSLVQAYWNRIYKNNTSENTSKFVARKAAPVAKIVKVRKSRNGLVRKVRNGGLVKVEQTVLAEKCIRDAERRIEAGKIIELPVKVTDISTRGNFGTKAFSLMR
jgi:hypothetical protein